MDIFDVIILNGKKFYLSSEEKYDINLNNVEFFLKENINNVPKIISFCDKIEFFCKRSYPEKAKELLILISTYTKTNYLIQTMLSSIRNILEYDITYTYIISYYELALTIINTEYSAIESVNYGLMSNTIIRLYEDHINNPIVSGYLIDNFIKNYHIIKQISSSLSLVMNTERNRYKICFIFKKIINKNVYLDETAIDMCCEILFILRNYNNDEDVKEIVELGLKNDQKIKLTIKKMNDGLLDKEQCLLQQLENIKMTNDVKKYYNDIILQIINIYVNCSDLSIKKICAYKLYEYINTNAVWIKGYYSKYFDKMNDIIKTENIA